MTQDKSRKEAEALYAYLRGEKSLDDQAVPRDEAVLGSALQRAAREMQADPKFKAALEKRLMNAESKQDSPPIAEYLNVLRRSLSGFGRVLTYAALTAALVFGLSWAVRSLVPRPDQAGGPAIQTPTISPTQTLGAPGVQRTPQADQDGTSSLPGGQVLVLNASFPETPAEVPIFQLASNSPVTPEEALQAAAQLGIQGEVYRSASESGDTNLVVSDGWAQVLFIGSTDRFSYFADMTTVLEDTPQGLPFEQQAAIAERWLVEHNLLDAPRNFRAEPLALWPNTVRFVPLADGRPVRYESFEAPQIDVEVSLDGKVVSVSYTRMRVEPAGQLPVIPAQEAWQRALVVEGGEQGQSTTGVVLTAREARPLGVQSWLREYPFGERVDLWDYASWLIPLDASAQPLVYFRNYPVAGDLQTFISQVTMGQFLHVWGQFDEVQGRRIFQLEGWEPAEENSGEGKFSEQYGNLTGTVQRDGERAFFKTESGQTILLPSLPADVPDGQQGAVWGKVQEGAEPYLEWHILQSQDVGAPADYRSGAIGGISLQPLAAPPTPPFPFQTGQRIDGMAGVIWIQIWEELSGVQTVEAYFSAGANTEFPEGFGARLVGPNLSGVEGYHQASVKLWGTITGQNGELPVVDVDRLELIEEAPQVQAWLGAWEAVTLDGKEVALFTDQDGQKYVIQTSLDLGLDSMVGRPGDSVIIEGRVAPDQTVGGYPVIENTNGQMAGRITDINQYTITSNQPQVMYREKGGWQVLPGGRMVVEKIELVYITSDLSHGSMPGPDAPPTYLQPAWRFTGHYEDGLEFEVLVQAAPETLPAALIFFARTLSGFLMWLENSRDTATNAMRES